MEEYSAKQKRTHPSAQANIFSRLFFLYSFTSADEEFDPNVIYRPYTCHESVLLGDRLQRSWSKHIRICHNNKKKPSVLKSIMKEFWPELLQVVILSIIEIILRLSETVCLGFVLSYFQPNATMSELQVSYWSIGMFVSIGLRIFVNSQQRSHTLDTSTKVQVACSNLVYRKALRLKSQTLQEDGCSKLVTLIAKDLGTYDSKMEFINYVYTAPIVVIAVIYIMYQEFAIPGLVGTVFILLVAVIQALFTSYISKLKFREDQFSDERMRLLNIFLSGMYVMKVFVWEESIAKLIREARGKELATISKSSLMKAILGLASTFIVPISIFLALYTVILERQEITVFMVFVMIIFYSLLSYVISVGFTFGLAKLLEISGVLKKVDEFMNTEEIILPDRKNSAHVDKVCIQLDNIFATWATRMPAAESDEDSFESTDFTEKTALLKVSKKVSKGDGINESMGKNHGEFSKAKDVSFLRNVSIKIEDGQLIGILGQVGSGKTSILQVILGEILISYGSKYISGRISYASQVPWIFTSNIRQNILFGSKYDESRYAEVIRVCGLEKDFQQFPHEDLTSIGDGEVYISNELKMRINLARALYRKADIYILDDPFSKASMKMANYLFDNCILGFLKNKCVILVTFHMGQLKNADNLIYMNNGRIEREGSYEDLQKSGLLSDDLRTTSPLSAPNQTSGEGYSILERDLTSWQINKLYPDITPNEDIISDENVSLCQEQLEEMKKSEDSLNEGMWLFKYLLASNKKCGFGMVILLFIATQITISSVIYFLGAWTTAEETRNTFQFLSPLILAFFNLQNEQYYENYFGLLVIALMVISFVFAFSYSRLIKTDSKIIHDSALEQIVGTNLRSLEVMKKIQFRTIFSKGLKIIDVDLPESIRESSQFILMTLGALVLLLLVQISFSFPVVILLLAFAAWVLIYSKCIGDLARMENKLFNNMLNHLCIPSHGIITSRAMAAQDTLINEFENHQDNYSSFCFLHGVYSIALAFYVDLSCFLFFVYITIATLFQVNHMGIRGGFIGVTFTQAISLIGIAQYGIRQALEVKIRLKEVQRITQYKNLKEEEEPQLTVDPPSQWPDEGKIVFDNVCFRYDIDLPLALKNLSFTIKPGEKIGIVGEDGEGKSSIVSAIFRLFIVDGCIEIDGFDSRDISLKLLRSKIAVVPQNPVLFSASLRFNLDPLGKYEDHTLCRILQSFELEDALGELYPLDYNIRGGGSNLSVGQKQLICLARALIGNKKILVLDEITPDLDPRTEALIQRIIKRKFRDCTVLTVSNRLNTLINLDKVMVLESGMIKEFDHPHKLLQNSSGRFYNMIPDCGTSESENLKKIAFENYIKWKI
ncbi:hypothetical protein WA026_003314 [Henosepilachna vigintioctopunctata]|uniref:Uncharacterized protein n=1 Tax=Henosepilachna vigintioctopunctata TaxID=420089 RepID=A0AAW1THC5_9CUCU